MTKVECHCCTNVNVPLRNAYLQSINDLALSKAFPCLVVLKCRGLSSNLADGPIYEGPCRH